MGRRAEETNPRPKGTNARAKGTNPRADRTNPRAEGTNRRAVEGRAALERVIRKGTITVGPPF